MEQSETSLHNEFATVKIIIRRNHGSEELEIRNAETDEVIRLDPLELEALTRMRHSDFGPLILT